MKNDLRTSLARKPWLLPFTVWIVLYAWRPLLFGFYHDDWSLLLGCNGSILQEVYCAEMSRPGAPLIRWAIHGLIGTNPVAWQFVTTISMLGAALTLMALLHRLAQAEKVSELRSGWAATTAAAFYLAFPWMLGIAWINGILTNVATIFFTLAMLTWFARSSLNARCIVSALCFLLSGLVYEAYWFAFLPFSALLLLRGTLPRRDLTMLAATLAGVQALLIGFNRIAAAISTGANKSYDPHWLHTVTGAWPTIVGGLRDIFGIGGRYAFGALLGVLLACLATRIDIRRSVATLGPILAGIALSFALFAVAGYVVVLTGLFARTTIALSWWLAVAAAYGALHVADLPKRVRPPAYMAAFALLLMLVGGTLTQSRYWISSWAEQQDILAKVPSEQLLAAPGPSFLVIEGPHIHDKLGAFGAWYDISAAIWMTKPDLARHLARTAMISSPIAVVSRGDSYFRMTPNRVTMYSCSTHNLLMDFQTAHILRWKYPDPTVEMISSDVGIDCVEGL